MTTLQEISYAILAREQALPEPYSVYILPHEKEKKNQKNNKVPWLIRSYKATALNKAVGHGQTVSERLL